MAKLGAALLAVLVSLALPVTADAHRHASHHRNAPHHRAHKSEAEVDEEELEMTLELEEAVAQTEREATPEELEIFRAAEALA